MLNIGVSCNTQDHKHRQQLRACQNTWCKNARKLSVPVFFLGDSNDTELDVIKSGDMNENSNLLKLLYCYKWMFDNHPKKFYYVCRTNTYVNIENLLDILSKYDPNEKLYIGGHGSSINFYNRTFYFHDGGAGFILSHALLKEIFDLFTIDGIYRLWRRFCLDNGQENLIRSCDIAIGYLMQFINDAKCIEEDHFYHCNNLGEIFDSNQLCPRNCSKSIEPDKIVNCHLMDPPLMYNYQNYVEGPHKYDEPISNWTVVTMLYHLPRYGDDFNKPIEFYLNNGLFVLSLPVNLVVYCDEPEKEFIMKVRSQYGFEKYTKVIAKPATEFSLFNLRHKIRKNRVGNHWYNKSNRNTPNYAALVSSKFNIVQDAIRNDYFNTEYFAWLDFGCKYIVGKYINEFVRCLECYRKQGSFCYLEYTPKDVRNNYSKYYQFGRAAFAATFFTGHKSYLFPIMAECERLFVETVNKGYGHAEEQIIPFIYFEHPEWFDLFYGYYYQLFVNYDKTRTNATRIINNIIAPARLDNEYYVGYHAAMKVLEAFEKEDLNVSFDKIIDLLDDAFICAYYLGKYKECEYIISKHRVFYELHGKSYLAEFDKKSFHIIYNSDFLLPHLDHNDKKITKIYISDANQIEYDYDKDKEVVFIYCSEPCSIDGLIINNPIIRPFTREFKIKYDQVIDLRTK